MAKRVIPAFATEAEEADWWYEHREETAQDIVDASREGRPGIGAVARLQQLRETRARTAADTTSKTKSESREQVLASTK